MSFPGETVKSQRFVAGFFFCQWYGVGPFSLIMEECTCLLENAGVAHLAAVATRRMRLCVAVVLAAIISASVVPIGLIMACFAPLA